MAETILPIPFGSGADTKSDPKSVQGNVLSLQDGVFTDPNRISKRNGMTPFSLASNVGGNISAPVMVKSFNNELICAAQAPNGATLPGGRLWSWSEAESNWHDRGKYVSAAISKQTVSVENIAEQNSSSAVLGNLTLVAYDRYNAFFSGVLISFFSVIDNETGSHVAADVFIPNSFGYARAEILGGSNLCVFYMNTSYFLCFRSVTLVSGVVTLGAEVSTSVQIALASTAVRPQYDVVTTGTGATFAAFDIVNGNIAVKPITTAGSVGTGTTVVIGGTYVWCLSFNQDSAGQYWIYWSYGAAYTSQNIKYAVLSASFAVGTYTTMTFDTNTVFNQITAISQSYTQQTVYYSVLTYGTEVVYPGIYNNTVTTGGIVGSPVLVLQNFDIYSKIFSFNGFNYLAVISYSLTQSTGYVIDLGDNQAIAKFLPGSAEGFTGATGLPGLPQNAGADLVSYRLPGYLNSWNSSGSSQFTLAAGVQLSGIQGLNNTSTITFGTDLIEIDFANIDAYQGLFAGNAIVLNGGIVSLYDGSTCAELGFNQYPDNIQVVVGYGGAGGISAGTYELVFTYQWIEVNGDVHECSSVPISVVVAAPSGYLTVTVQNLGLTGKTNVSITGWLSAVNGGQVLYQATPPVLNNPSSQTTIFVIDSLPNVSIPILSLYTNGNVVENVAPPPAMVMMAAQNRAWLIDSENPTNSIWYSKTYSPGTGLSFSDFLTLTIDPKAGNITTLAEMDEKTCIIKQSGVFIATGNGADDTGANSTFSSPQVVPSDVGGIYSRGSIVIPEGLAFKTQKGIYLLSRGLSISYFGMAMEEYNSQNLEDAQIAPNTSQVRFLTSSGLALVYDYIFKKWGTFSNYQGFSSTNWQGNYVYCRTDGMIYQENSTTFLDNTTPYGVQLQIAWVKAAGVQGFQRVRRAIVLGDHISPAAGHAVQISTAYDFVESFGAGIGYALPVKASQSVFQYRERMPRQKCDALGLFIQEIVTGATGEYVDFTDLSLEVMPKQGVNKLPGAASVG